MTDIREPELLSRLPQDGSFMGNTRLLRELRWPEVDYWAVRNRLVDRGVLEIGRGRGAMFGELHSTIRRTPRSEYPPPPIEEVAEIGITCEADLYEPLARVVEQKWVLDKRVESAIVRITAVQGRRPTGGKWTRPDITVATLSTYPYVPGRHFDVVTFEVKTSGAIDVTAVYEALAHLRCATRSYVLVHVPDNRVDDLEEDVIEVCSEAKKHGIGVITVGDPTEYETWNERVEAIRSEPDPRKLNDFLAKQLTHDQLERVVRWFR